MANLVLNITQDEARRINANFYYRDVDAFTDTYGTNKVDILTDIEAVKASVRNILVWHVGERILYPQFGNKVRNSLFNQLTDATKSEIAEELTRAVEENDNRVKIKQLGVVRDSADDDHGVVQLQLVYEVVAEKRGNGLTVTDSIKIENK